MAFEAREDSDEVMNEINMTPLVDVMLVLLIIFIITVPVMKHSVNVDLPRATNQPEQIKPACRHILPNIAGLERKTLLREFFEDFHMQQMKLAQIGLRWITRNAGAMLDRNAGMRITFHAKPGEQLQAFKRLLAEAMRAILGKRLDVRCCHARPSGQSAAILPISPVVEASCGFCGAPAPSSGRMALANCLPSSTPH